MFEFKRADKISELVSFCQDICEEDCILDECPMSVLPCCGFEDLSDDELNVAWDLYCGNKRPNEV